MTPDKKQLDEIARQAEADLNTYQAKTGVARPEADDAAGVRTMPEGKFENVDVKYGDDLSTNASYNKRIPPEEGGDLDARGRQARGEHYDHHHGEGGPESKIRAQLAENPGQNDRDVERVEGLDSHGAGKADALSRGEDATVSNVGRNPPGPGGSQFPGSEYYTPESVRDSIAAEGHIPPESVTQASRETEGYGR